MQVWLLPPLPPQVLQSIIHLPFPCHSALGLSLVFAVWSPLTHQCSILFWPLSCHFLPPPNYPLWKWPYSSIFHLFTSYSLSNSGWAIVCTCHSGKTTPRQTLQRLLVLTSVVVVMGGHRCPLRVSPSWMLHEWSSPDLSPPPGCCSGSRCPCPTPTGTGGHIDLVLLLSFSLSLSPLHLKKLFWQLTVVSDVTSIQLASVPYHLLRHISLTSSPQLHLVLGCFHLNGPVNPKLKMS